MDRNRFAIGVLSITATVLLVGVILLSAADPVRGIGMNARGGDYVMTTVQSGSSTENLLVVDAAADRLILYQYNVTRQRLEPLAAQDIRQLVRPDERSGRSGRSAP